MSDIYCFYHSGDFDGIASGAIVKYHIPDCIMVPIDYGDHYDWDSIPEESTVFMCDFSLQPFSRMVELNKRTALIWIDHHISAMKEEQLQNDIFAGLRDTQYSGCQLTWSYFHPDNSKKMPKVVNLLGEYDVWRTTDAIMDFHYGMKAFPTEKVQPGTQFWSAIFSDPLFDTLIVDSSTTKGKTINAYQATINEQFMKTMAFEASLFGVKAICYNGRGNSSSFKSVYNPDVHDIMLLFSMMKSKTWTISLYTTKTDTIDCSEIAKLYGGGGHKGAAGFQLNDIHFLFNGNLTIV